MIRAEGRTQSHTPAGRDSPALRTAGDNRERRSLRSNYTPLQVAFVYSMGDNGESR